MPLLSRFKLHKGTTLHSVVRKSKCVPGGGDLHKGLRGKAVVYQLIPSKLCRECVHSWQEAQRGTSQVMTRLSLFVFVIAIGNFSCMTGVISVSGTSLHHNTRRAEASNKALVLTSLLFSLFYCELSQSLKSVWSQSTNENTKPWTLELTPPRWYDLSAYIVHWLDRW